MGYFCAGPKAYGLAALVGGLLVGVLGCDRVRTVPLREDAGAGDAPPAVREVALRLRGILPARGPHTGQTQIVVTGTGFVEGSTVVSLDGVEVDPERVRVLGTGQLTFLAPPHLPGVVDIAVEVGGRSAALPYTYESLSFEPSLGSVDGGQRVSIRGAATLFQSGDVFEFGRAPCTELVVVSSTEANCRVPAHGIGRVDVIQRRGTESLAAALEAFEYVDVAFVTGGVSGESIEGSVRVAVVGLDGPVANARVRLGDTPEGVPLLEGRTDSLGQLVLEHFGLRGPLSVHVGHECYSRTSIVGFDARTLVVPLRIHRFGGACPEPPSGGGGSFASPPEGLARGVVVFLEGREFPSPTRRWVGVPEPRDDEQYVAYVWAGDRFLDRGLGPDDFDETRGGIPFALPTPIGTTLLCAMAGLQPRGTERSVANLRTMERFVSGCSSVYVDGRSEEVAIEMQDRLSDLVEVEVAPLPALDIPNARSPLVFETALPSSVGVYVRSFFPALALGLSAEERRRASSAPFVARFERRPAWAASAEQGYVFWGDEDSGAGSAVYLRPGEGRASDGVTHLAASPMGVPRFVVPSPGGSFEEREVRFALDGAGSPDWIELTVSPEVYSLGSSGPRWYVYARGDLRLFTLPRDADAELAWTPGRYQIDLSAAEMPGFDFNSWTFESLRPGGGTRRVSRNRLYARVSRGGS